MSKIYGTGVPIKKAAYGTEYTDKQSGISYIQTTSPTGSDWSPTIDTTASLNSNLPTETSSGSGSLIQKAFDNKGNGVFSYVTGDFNQANANFSITKGLGNTAGNTLRDFYNSDQGNFIVIPEVNVISEFYVGGTATVFDSARRAYTINIINVFTGNTGTTTGVTSGITSGSTSGITSGLSLYTAIEIDAPLESGISNGQIVDQNIGVASYAEGLNTQAKGNASHSQNSNTIANGLASHAEGLGSISNSVASHAGGIGSIANHTGELARSSGFISNPGDVQYSLINLFGQTTASGPTELFVDGISERIKIYKNSLVSFEIIAQGMLYLHDTASLIGNGASFKVNCVMAKNINNEATLYNFDDILTPTKYTDNSQSGLQFWMEVGNSVTGSNGTPDYVELIVYGYGIDDQTHNWNILITMIQSKV